MVCFSARARDAVGNVSPWSADSCVARPLDDRVLSTRGAVTRATGSGFYLGTATRSATRGASFTRTGVLPGRVAVVVSTGRGYGSIGAYYNGRLVRTLSLASVHSLNRRVVQLPWMQARGTITFKVLTNGKPVVIDGLLLARS